MGDSSITPASVTGVPQSFNDRRPRMPFSSFTPASLIFVLVRSTDPALCR